MTPVTKEDESRIIVRLEVTVFFFRGGKGRRMYMRGRGGWRDGRNEYRGKNETVGVR